MCSKDDGEKTKPSKGIVFLRAYDMNQQQKTTFLGNGMIKLIDTTTEIPP